MTPLAWIWLSTFTRSLLWGCDYFQLRRGSLADAWFVAGVVTRTCRSIRTERQIR